MGHEIAPSWPAQKCKGGTDDSLFQIFSVLAHVSPERASGRPAKGNALDQDGHEKVVFRANGPTSRLRRPVGPLGRENHPLAFRLPGRCPSLGDGLGLRPARALQFHAEQNCSACSSIQGPIFREFCAGQPRPIPRCNGCRTPRISCSCLRSASGSFIKHTASSCWTLRPLRFQSARSGRPITDRPPIRTIPQTMANIAAPAITRSAR